MISNEHIKAKAIQLRLSGHSLPQICEMLDRSKTTVYYWIKNLDCEADRVEKFRTENFNLARVKGVAAMQAKYNNLRDVAYKEGKILFETHQYDKFFRDFILIYLTEGFRKTKNVVAVSNSNPAIIALSCKFLRSFSKKPLDFNLQFYPDQEPNTLAQFWADLLKIDPTIIHLLPKSNAGRLSGRKWNCKNGVMSVRVNDTYFRSKVQAWMDAVEGEWKELGTISK